MRFQRCDDCGTPRFPWLPGCNACGSARWTAQAASGEGTVYSCVVVHHPLPAAFDRPYAVALVELAEGVRMVSNVIGADPAQVRIGQPVRLCFERCDEELTLPLFRPATDPEPTHEEPAHAETTHAEPVHAGPAGPVSAASPLPELRVPVSRTLIVAGAIATRDFQDVHHDAELARAKGSPDIFMNILTTNGLVGRYAADCAGAGWSLAGIAIRLGVPAYPGDELCFNGEVLTSDNGQMTMSVIGRTDRGNHVTATVTLHPVTPNPVTPNPTAPHPATPLPVESGGRS
ncbi:hypothetical protein GXW82_31970 [Streptacidiphilus sp. 4-A2]|nr:hypothetical protein [Streptacidiphilus sp. 4-A2]